VVAYFLVPETGTQNRTATGATMFSGFVRLFSNPILRSRHPHRLHHRPFLIVASIVHIDEGAPAPARH
jgi:hypothetical protein